MMDLSNLGNDEKIQAVINTLKTLEMPPTFDNVNKMTGIYTTLMQVRDDIHAAEDDGIQVTEVEDGEADTE